MIGIGRRNYSVLAQDNKSLFNTFFIGQDSGGKIVQQSLGTAQPQEKVLGSSSVQQNIQVERTFIFLSLEISPNSLKF